MRCSWGNLSASGAVLCSTLPVCPPFGGIGGTAAGCVQLTGRGEGDILLATA